MVASIRRRCLRRSFPGVEAPLIVCRGLGKTYAVRIGNPVVALENLNVEISAGEFLAVVGPSGCGKSTLLRLLAGLDRQSRGVMELGGNAIDGPRKDIGVIFQTPTLFAWRTVLENIMLPVDVLGLNRKSYIQDAMQLVQMVGQGGFEKKYPWELSGGMQQRAAICRALINQPQLLLMDEPFGALDALTRESMNVELEDLAPDAKNRTSDYTFHIGSGLPREPRGNHDPTPRNDCRGDFRRSTSAENAGHNHIPPIHRIRPTYP